MNCWTEFKKWDAKIKVLRNVVLGLLELIHLRQRWIQANYGIILYEAYKLRDKHKHKHELVQGYFLAARLRLSAKFMRCTFLR